MLEKLGILVLGVVIILSAAFAAEDRSEWFVTHETGLEGIQLEANKIFFYPYSYHICFKNIDNAADKDKTHACFSLQGLAHMMGKDYMEMEKRHPSAKMEWQASTE